MICAKAHLLVLSGNFPARRELIISMFWISWLMISTKQVDQRILPQMADAALPCINTVASGHVPGDQLHYGIPNIMNGRFAASLIVSRWSPYVLTWDACSSNATLIVSNIRNDWNHSIIQTLRVNGFCFKITQHDISNRISLQKGRINMDAFIKGPWNWQMRIGSLGEVQIAQRLVV